MKKILVLALTGLLTVTVATAVSAAKPDAPKKKEPKVVQVQQLKPDPSSEAILSSLEAVKFSDGSVTIRGKEKLQASTTLGFQYSIDLKKGTYKTTKLEVPFDLGKGSTQTKQESNLNAVSNSGEVSIAAYTSHKGVVRVTTQDPIGWETCWTEQEINWNAYSDGTADWTSRSLSYWVGQPTKGNTNWFLNDYYWLGAPTYGAGNTSVTTEAVGYYFNFDWGDDNQRTDANHYNKIIGYGNGTMDFNWGATHSGEDSWLLDGIIYAQSW